MMNIEVDNETAPAPLRILHLAFEDHRQPGSGGGSLRTREINTRLAERHQITSVVARYKGATRRVEDGITYQPLGLALGRAGSIVSYHLALPWFVMRHRADVIVEDFAAPHSSNLVPLWTQCPTVAVVQYLFAREKSRQYHLPLWVLEETGVRMHRYFVTVSRHIADRISAVNAEAVVDAVYAGVDPEPGPATGAERRDLLYIGRLEFEQKGLDFLVDALAVVLRARPETRLRIAGDGPGRERLAQLLSSRGLAGAVDWLGRLEGRAKWDALRQAAVIVMPSRFETFGLVALEAMAVGTPVVGFNLPSLQEIDGESNSLTLLEPEDGLGLGRAASDLLGDPGRRRQIARAGLARAAQFDWDQAARAQERLYRAAIADHRSHSGRGRLRLFLACLCRLRRRQPGDSARPRGPVDTRVQQGVSA